MNAPSKESFAPLPDRGMIQKNCILITSAGRTGTMFFGEVLEEIVHGCLFAPKTGLPIRLTGHYRPLLPEVDKYHANC